LFITFEGAEGCGKSTQAAMLKEHLEKMGKNVILTQEPGGTALGKGLRKILLDPQVSIDETTEIYLFAADRSDHVSKIIKPALSEGNIVISDRYVDSTLAYQIGGRNLPEDLVRYINMVSSHGLKPDLTILLDVIPVVGLKRAAKRSRVDRFEQETIEFHQRVRDLYLMIAKNEPDRVKVINTDEAEIEDVQEQIQDLVKDLL